MGGGTTAANLAPRDAIPDPGQAYEALSALLRRHGAGLAMALLLAAILVAPRWWLLSTHPDDGVRIEVSPFGAGKIGFDESLHMPLVRAAYDGGVPISDLYLVSHASDTPQPSAVPEELTGLLGRMTGGISTSVALVSTLAAIGAFAMLYVLAFELTASRRAALAILPVAAMAIAILNQADGIAGLRHPDVLRSVITADPQRQLHAWTRFPAPILDLAPFFIAVIALPKAVLGRSWRWGAIAALSLAMLIYAYLFYWTALALALALWGASLLYQRDYPAARRLALIGAAALLLATPEIVVLIKNATQLPSDVSARIGLDSPGIDLSGLGAVAQRLIVGLPFLWSLRNGANRNALYAALFVSPLALLLLAGVTPQPWHFRTQVWGVFAIPALVAGAAAIARRIPHEYARAAAAGFAAVALLGVIYVGVLQARATQTTDAAYAVTPGEHAAFSWIDAHLGRNDTVVSSSVTTNLLLGARTSASEYLGNGWGSTATDDELADRLFRAQAAFGYTADAVIQRLRIDGEFGGFPLNGKAGSREQLEASLEQALGYVTFNWEITHPVKYNARLGGWRSRYAELLTTQNVLAAYDAGYLYCGHRERLFPVGMAAPGTMVRVAFSSGEVTLYQLAGAKNRDARPFTGCG